MVLMNALSSLSRLRITKGDLDEAIQLQRRAEEIARGQRIGAEAAASYGYALALGGRVAEGVARLEAQRAAMDQVGWNVLRAAFIQTLAHAYAIAGRLEEAEACGQESLTLARERGERGAEGWALWVLGETAWRREAGSVARGRFEEALGIAAELGMRPLEAYCELGLGRLLAREGEAKGEALLARAAALAREMDMRFWPA